MLGSCLDHALDLPGCIAICFSAGVANAVPADVSKPGDVTPPVPIILESLLAAEMLAVQVCLEMLLISMKHSCPAFTTPPPPPPPPGGGGYSPGI